MFWRFCYFNNPFMMNTFFMPNFFFNFGFNNFGFQNFCMPSFFVFNPPVIYNNTTSIFNIPRQNTQINTTQSTNFGTATAKQHTTVNTTKRTETTATKISDSANTQTKQDMSAFLERTKEIANKINCDYKDLLALMNAESNLDPQAVNRSSGATGLIQFMPKTAKELGTTTKKLRNMTAIEQLDYVEKYLVKYKQAAGFKSYERLDSGDLYALVFLPGRAKREILTDSSEIYYAPNASALDLNNDGKISKTELAQRLEKHKVNESIFLT